MKDKFNNIMSGGYKIICSFLFVAWTLIMIFMLINSDHDEINSYTYMLPNYNEGFLSFLTVLTGGIILILSLVYIYRLIIKVKEKNHDKIAKIIFVVSFSILALWGLSHRILFTYDVPNILDKIFLMFNQNNHYVGYDYLLSKYPANIPLLALIYVVEFFGKLLFNSPENTMIIYNCFMISLTFYFIYKILKKLFNSKIALFGMLLAALNPYFYLYASYYYTDITSIPFAVIGIYCLIKANDEVKIKKYFYLILGGGFFAISSQLRIVSSFLLVAYVIDLILKGNLKEAFKKIVTVLTVFLSSYFIIHFCIYYYFSIKIDERISLPATHYIMMGLNYDTGGGFDMDDVNFSTKQEDKIISNLKVIKNRLLNKSDVDFFLKKLAYTWTDNRYIALLNYRKVLPIDASYSYIYGHNRGILKYILKIVRFATYSLFLITIGKELLKKDHKKSKVSVFIISIFGAILFYMFWESMDRYSFSFLPWVILGGASSIVTLDKILKTNKLSFDNKNIKTIKIKKVLAIVLIISLIIVLFEGFIEYSVRKKEIHIVRVNNMNATSLFSIKKEIVEEYFTVDKNFNKIELVFNDKSITEVIPYIFELYNDNNELIYKEEFMSTIGSEYFVKNFEFPEVELNESKEYHFKIYSEEASNDNFLKVSIRRAVNCVGKPLVTENLGYDFNPTGKTYINGDPICYEISYSVTDHIISNGIRKIYYIIFAVIVLFLSYIGVYNCLIKKSGKNLLK